MSGQQPQVMGNGNSKQTYYGPCLHGGSAAFIWMRDSGPVYTTSPTTKPLFFSVQPRSRISFMVTATVSRCGPSCREACTHECRRADRKLLLQQEARH